MSFEQIFVFGFMFGLMSGFVISGIIWIIYDIRQELKEYNKQKALEEK